MSCMTNLSFVSSSKGASLLSPLAGKRTSRASETIAAGHEAGDACRAAAQEGKQAMIDGASVPRHIEVRPDWLALHTEDILEPELPIVDAHHHFHDWPTTRYLLQGLLQDINYGPNIRATLY